ncbi:hypothetical protein StoSoilB22_27390 [Arthrobacter sp. StoSoilB22]|nr:hypothetical protein StoSoilB22_27390 [Arthrobacter sp. StoSoilB22]
MPGIRDNARWTPTTSCPASTARAAATAESTPPLIAASTRMLAFCLWELEQLIRLGTAGVPIYSSLPCHAYPKTLD